MRASMRWAVLIVTAFSLLMILAPPSQSADPAAPAKAALLKVGDAVPELMSRNMEGKDTSLNSLLQPKMLNVLAFSSTTCYACNAEASVLSSLKGKYPDKINLIGIVVDLNTNGYKMLEPSIKKNFSYLHDAKYKLTPVFGFHSTPATALIKEGKIVALESGFEPADPSSFVKLIESNL